MTIKKILEAIKKKLDEKDIGFNYNRYKEFMINVDLKTLKKNLETINEIHLIRNKKVIDDE